MKMIVRSLIALVLLSCGVLAQDFKALPFGITESNFIEQIRELKAKDPKITPETLAATANEFFKTNGFSFTVFLGATECAKIQALAKDPKAKPALSGAFQSVGGEKVRLNLPPVAFGSEACGGCSVQFPVFEITQSYFVTKVNGINVKVVFPSNFSTNLIGLASDDGTKINKLWRVPFRSTPIGISYDQTVVYLGFDDPELSALSIAVFDSGGFEISTRKEAEDGGAGKLEPRKQGSPDQIILFDRWELKSRLIFNPKC